MRAQFRRMAVAIFVASSSVACGDSLWPESDYGVEYLVDRFEIVEESEEWAPFPIAYLVAEIALINRRPDSLELAFGDCSLELEGVEAREGPDARMWRSQTRMTWPTTIGHACLAYLKSGRIGPGDTLRTSELSVRYSLAEILADSLPAGRYAFDAIVSIAEQARIELGPIHLPTSHYPIPQGVAYRDGFRYEVRVEAGDSATDHEASATLEIELSAPSSIMSLDRTLSATCPLRLLAFSEPDDAITIPLPEPAWRWPESCGPGQEVVRLGTGETRVFEGKLDVAELLAGGADPGRYYLMALIPVDDRPVRMLAGEIELRP